MRSKYLNDKEIAALRRVMSLEEWLPFQIALETGLRIGDVAKLAWRDVQGSALRYVAQKTGKPGKTYVTEETATVLWRLRRRTRSRWCFPSPRDNERHITRQALWKRLKSACKTAMVNADGVSPHSLRKVYGVREYREHGMSAAQAGLQHSDIGTTELYVLSDWLTADNADEPLRRSDLSRVLHFIADWLGIPRKEPPR